MPRMGVYHSAPLTYPAGQFPTFLTGSGSAIAAIVEARRMRTPPSDGAIPLTAPPPTQEWSAAFAPRIDIFIDTLGRRLGSRCRTVIAPAPLPISEPSGQSRSPPSTAVRHGVPVP